MVHPCGCTEVPLYRTPPAAEESLAGLGSVACPLSHPFENIWSSWTRDSRESAWTGEHLVLQDQLFSGPSETGGTRLTQRSEIRPLE